MTAAFVKSIDKVTFLYFAYGYPPPIIPTLDHFSLWVDNQVYFICILLGFHSWLNFKGLTP